jgi:hypothetical protein
MSRFLNAGSPTRGLLRVLGTGSVLAAVAPTLAVIGLAWTLPACCCGGGSPQPITQGPPGTISGRLIPPSPGAAKAAVVYAVSNKPGSDVLDATRYAMTRVDAASPTYSLTVPTGYYNLIARFDSEPLRFGGYTFNVKNNGNGADYALVSVGVSAQQRVEGIDIGSWGTRESVDLGWSIDVHGLPLFDPLLPSASATDGAIRDSPPQPDPILSSNYVNTAFGVHFLLPIGWSEVKAPGAYPSYAFFANENVASPLQLDDKGVWLSILYGGLSCPAPDWRFVVATLRVRLTDSVESFYLEDPPAIVGPQPFTGSGLFAGATHAEGKQCVQFIFKGATKAAMESNLPALVSLLHVAGFQ